MPRLSQKDKEALCAGEKNPIDKDICMQEYDYYSDYQDAKQAGKFTGNFDDYKKSIGLGVITWTSTSTNNSGKKEDNKKPKNSKLIIGIGIGILALIAAAVAYKKLKK